MSLWDNVKKFTQPYTDDEDDDEYDDYDEEESVDVFQEEPQPAERPAARKARRTPAFTVPTGNDSSFASTASSGSTASGFSGQVVTMGGNRQEVVLFHPANFNDTSKAADHLRAKKAVIVNMENVDKTMARRVVDFLSGCAYAVDGKVKKVAQSTYLFCPHSMEIVGDLENIQSEVESYV